MEISLPRFVNPSPFRKARSFETWTNSETPAERRHFWRCGRRARKEDCAREERFWYWSSERALYGVRPCVESAIVAEFGLGLPQHRFSCGALNYDDAIDCHKRVLS